MSQILLSILGSMPSSFLELGAQVGIWLLKRAGAKEEEIKSFESAIREIQTSRDLATAPHKDEAASLDELKRQIYEEQERKK